MIRVTLRDSTDTYDDAHLLGDFPPSEIADLLDLIRRTCIYDEAEGEGMGGEGFVNDVQYQILMPQGGGRALLDVFTHQR